jgi:hypothetical protein
MNPTELKMSTSEIAQIKGKVENSTFFMIAFITFIGIWLWLFNDSEAPYFVLTSVISAFLILLTLYLIYAFFKKIKETKDDIKNQIKIINVFEVVDKHTSGSKNTKYIIVFNSKDIPKYQVTQTVFNTINIHDTVSVEYSKFAFWILKIQHNGVDIENKRMIA